MDSVDETHLAMTILSNFN